MTAAADTAAETGTRDVTYNLISVAYHALQGAETYTVYVDDAERAGNRELADFFRRAQETNRDLASEAKELLKTMLAKSTATQ